MNGMRQAVICEPIRTPIGRPVGATGGRMLATLARKLDCRGARYGLETMCIGGGQGLAAVLERVVSRG